ncbi:MAG: hypothetical protein IPP72_21400 [Chitinophagaceae bacterium]|nr:hypothetical protein [Chitinophagaceae bacterium]
MKVKWINLFLLYILVPAIITGIVVKSGAWWGLFCVLTYFIGLIISKFRQWIFLPIPLLFVFWYWYTYGFAVRDYVTMYFACLVCGILFNQISKEYYKFVSKILPEQLTNLDYNEKVDELNRRLDKYRYEHPNEKLTPEIVEKIRTDVFF